MAACPDPKECSLEHEIAPGVHHIPVRPLRPCEEPLDPFPDTATDRSKASTFTVANLYYNQPILNKIAQTFNVSYEESAQTATLLQAGYAAGLILLLPLGDMVERRLFIIALVFFTATLVRLNP